ncbi:MAG TPA: hypothetical protein PL096_00965 [Micropepsaceae bacterium]|nr:hypothetical protein [Micropepsaceae bacterium]
MRKFIIGLAALAGLAFTAAPAAADDWIQFSSAYFGQGDSTETVYPPNGRYSRIKIKANNHSATCRFIRAHFANGNTRDIFSGNLREGNHIQVDLPGAERNITRLTFRCRSTGNGRTRIGISGWGDLRSGGGGGGANWELIGYETFHSWFGGDREQQFTRFAGSMDRLGFRATDDDAFCRRITIHYGNGRTRNVTVGDGGYMREDRTYSVDLHGSERNVRKVVMVCRPQSRSFVTIGIYRP